MPTCSFAMYYFCAFRCFTAASTSSSFCSVEQGSFWMDFQRLLGLELRQLLPKLLLRLL